MAEKTWINKSDREIRDDIVAIAKENTKLTNFKSTGVLRGFIEVFAACVVFVYKSAINLIYDNATLNGATGFFLTCWGLLLGVARKQANKAVGNFTGHPHGNGSIPEGAWILVEGTDLRYKVTQKVQFEEDTDFQIPVIAEFTGGNYNIGSQMPLRITRVIQGLGMDAIVAGEEWIKTLGENIEEDNPYRERIKNRWRDQTLGDTKETYRFYAEEVPGVRSAQIIRAPRGPGSTDVIIASVIGQPGVDLIQAVEENLHAHELMAFDVQVKAPTIENIEIGIEFRGDADEAYIALIAETYIYNLGIGGRFRKDDFYCCYHDLNLETFEVITPSRDIQPEPSGIIVASIAVTKLGAAP
jgi:uncharacterized phage protein gp47/JayE